MALIVRGFVTDVDFTKKNIQMLFLQDYYDDAKRKEDTTKALLVAMRDTYQLRYPSSHSPFTYDKKHFNVKFNGGTYYYARDETPPGGRDFTVSDMMGHVIEALVTPRYYDFVPKGSVESITGFNLNAKTVTLI
jgi:hypothetical protein